jgi:hypothetical protein
MPAYSIGDRVRVANAAPPGHVRTPSFVRGREGVIIRHFGAFPNPERLAYGMSGLPKLDLYQVKFDMDEIWSGDGSYAPGDTVTADIYESWLTPVEES